MKNKDVFYRLTTNYVKTLFRTKQNLCQNFKTMSVKNDPAQKKCKQLFETIKRLSKKQCLQIYHKGMNTALKETKKT